MNTIYIHTNKINGKVYIGQTWITMKKRWFSGNGYRDCVLFNRAIKKYGAANFTHAILTFCGTQETADYWEMYFIQKYNSNNPKFGYDLKSGGSHGKHSEETKRKLSLAFSISLRENTNSVGHTVSDIHKEILRKTHTGRIPSEAAKKKMSDARKLWHANRKSGNITA